jgi:hypothetical protein
VAGQDEGGEEVGLEAERPDAHVGDAETAPLLEPQEEQRRHGRRSRTSAYERASCA